MEEVVRVPMDRIAAVIGKDGATSKRIENLTKARLEINSETGEVRIEGTGKPLDFYNALNIVKAIARGFAPKKAFLLSNPDHYLDVLNLREIGSKKKIASKKGRVIGRNGKARESIENYTNCFLSVYGKTISIIGKAEDIENAREAVEMLLEGANHQTVLNFLKKKEREKQKFEL